MEPDDTQAPRPRTRQWQALDETPRPAPPTHPHERGAWAFFRKLLNLFLLDPRSGAR